VETEKGWEAAKGYEAEKEWEAGGQVEARKIGGCKEVVGHIYCADI